MSDVGSSFRGVDEPALRAEIVRLNKVVRALMDRAERSINVQNSDFGLFQTTVLLEEQVRKRTAELDAALRENEKINRALRESETRLREIVNQPLVGIVIVENGRFSYSNGKFNQIFGYDGDEVRQLGPLDVVLEADRSLVAENMKKRLSGEVEQIEYVFRGLRKDRTEIDIEIHGSTMELDGKRALISVMMDVTARTHAERKVRELQETLRSQSLHDALTGLYNRRYLEDTLSRELIAAARNGYPISLIMADLDHFKVVNDRYGHPAGDEVLRVFGNLLARHARGSDICCRYGGEEFLLILPRLEKDKAIERAEQLRSAIATTSTHYGDVNISVTVSFGVAAYPCDAKSTGELIAAVDRALYAAKAGGRNRVSAGPGATISNSAGNGGGAEQSGGSLR